MKLIYKIINVMLCAVLMAGCYVPTHSVGVETPAVRHIKTCEYNSSTAQWKCIYTRRWVQK